MSWSVYRFFRFLSAMADQPGKNSSALMLAQLHFQIGPISADESQAEQSTTWCDDPVVSERILQAVREGLVLRINAESCRKANCSQLTAQCVQNGTTESNLR